MPSWPVLISQAFNGLALGTLLALVSSGLTIILGTLGVLNFAHGALFAHACDDVASDGGKPGVKVVRRSASREGGR